MLRIDELLERRPGEISGGQKQRTALARTLVANPEVYLLDEPISHLDARIRHELRQQFHNLEELRRVATLYVTHDYAEALSLGDRIGVMGAGGLGAGGDRPRDLRAAGLPLRRPAPRSALDQRGCRGAPGRRRRRPPLHSGRGGKGRRGALDTGGGRAPCGSPLPRHGQRHPGDPPPVRHRAGERPRGRWPATGGRFRRCRPARRRGARSRSPRPRRGRGRGARLRRHGGALRAARLDRGPPRGRGRRNPSPPLSRPTAPSTTGNA